jgi:hypothetical protein
MDRKNRPHGNPGWKPGRGGGLRPLSEVVAHLLYSLSRSGPNSQPMTGQCR